ncbi:MAG: hypothetical protein IKT98_04840 [Selenomonadaceae bacterium]|nr:hypothetical protein [Selenomonadaceae bacterium]
MTEQEKINQQLQNQIDLQNARLDKALSNFDTKFNMMLEEIRQQREDMRRLWDRQDAIQAKHDAEMHEMNKRFYDKFDAMDKKIDDNFKTLSNQIHNNFVQTMLGFGAIAAAVGGLVVAAFK